METEQKQNQEESETGLSESKLSEAAARREARRKRILENSNKRLGKITGREHNDAPLVSRRLLNEKVINLSQGFYNFSLQIPQK